QPVRRRQAHPDCDRARLCRCPPDQGHLQRGGGERAERIGEGRYFRFPAAGGSGDGSDRGVEHIPGPGTRAGCSAETTATAAAAAATAVEPERSPYWQWLTPRPPLLYVSRVFSVELVTEVGSESAPTGGTARLPIRLLAVVIAAVIC